MTLHKPSLVLAAKYLAVIMIISIFFSVNMYNTSVQELGRGYGRFGAGINRSLSQQQLAELREEQVAISRQSLISRLMIINAFVLLGGGVISYYLARKTLEPIEQAHEAQIRFTSDASHELRTPITAMRSETEAFLMAPKPKLLEAKAVMRSNIEELEKITVLIGGLLRLARSSEMKPNLSHITIQKLVESGIDKVKNQAKEKHITIESVIDNKETAVLVDSELISDAVKQLLENSIKFCEPSKTIIVAAGLRNRKLFISIQDEGPGIKQSQLPHIFDRFYQGDGSRSKSSASGFGIGLSIVKSVIELHEGEVDVKSELGSGTKFTITIPQG